MAVIGAALSSSEAAGAVAVWGGSTVTAESFLAWTWATLRDGKELPPAKQIPSENIHMVTKTKSKSEPTIAKDEPDATAITSEADSCPKTTGELVRIPIILPVTNVADFVTNYNMLAHRRRGGV